MTIEFFLAQRLLNKLNQSNQSLVGLVVIDAEFDRDDHSLIPRNYDRERAGTT
jgi:pyrimidine operon attenuation protein/uracil phosphoribosyltransferase